MVKKCELTFKDGCEKYLDNCRQRNLREGTINHYKQSYKQFYKFFNPEMKLTEITLSQYKEYVCYLRERISNDISINAYLRDFIISYDSRIGFSITQPSDKLIEWCIDEELEEIKVHRLDFYGYLPPVNGGDKAPAGGNLPAPPPRRKPSSTRKYICPKCGMSVRATKTVNIACIDCGNVKMIEVERI